MGVAAPPAVPEGVLQRIAFDLRVMRETRGQYPAGDLGFSVARTREFERDPLPLLLDCYARFGPVFTLRLLYAPVVFALGPEANHYITVSHASNFRWREGSLGDLIPLLGDGLLTTDGEYHKRARRIMLPAFHREQIAAATGVMTEETDRGLEGWHAGRRLDLYAWTRRLALRIAMRALFGFDPDRSSGGRDMAEVFERTLGFWGREYIMQMLRGPGSPVAADAAVAHSSGPRDLRRDRPAATQRRARPGHSQPPARRTRRGRVGALAARAARPGDDAALRRSRHHHVHRLVPLLRAGPQSERARAAALRHGLGVTPARHGHRRDAANVPARLDRPAALDRALRALRRPGAGRGDGQLLLLGEPPPPGRVSPSPSGSAPSASPPRAAPRCPREPTSRSAAAHAPASACASGWPR